MVEHITNLVNFIGGLGMFFYGVETMSASMQKAVGERFKNVLKTMSIELIKVYSEIRTARILKFL